MLETLNITCRVCLDQNEVKVQPNDLSKYRAGAHAQDVFPYLSADQRELIISGVCGKYFDEMFADEEDEL
jgi:hypothetical protein